LLADDRDTAVEAAMVAAANMVEVAALVGDTARATILNALMSGQVLTGSELAFLARISRPTASEHLAKPVNARLIAVTRKRRFSYYRIASPLVARMLESIKAVAAIEVPPRHRPRSAQDDNLRFARTCYDHLAGHLGVAIADALVARGHIVLAEDGGEVMDAGARFLSVFGAELTAKSRSRRIFSASLASIGASAAITSRVSSVRRSCGAAWRLVGLGGTAIRGRCWSPRRDRPACATRSA
jgi:DNA-binding transcriptional ArsR family regulator